MESYRYRMGRDGYDHHHQQHGHDPPSFSSTLLDSIYRSFDDSAPAPDRRSSTRPDACRSRDQVLHSASSSMDLADSWRRSLKAPSSHDAHSLYASTNNNNNSNNNNNKSLKPIRTSRSETSFSDEAVKREGGRASAKSRAMKLYGDLKRMKKQPPISPGAKLAAFLNSLFSATSTPKKQRTSSSSSYTASTPTCSTTCSHSRSCLTKTPSSAGVKRSVRFSPVDENLASPTHKSSQEEVKLRDMEKNRRVEEAAMELLTKNYNTKDTLEMADEEEDYNDGGQDAESCCSSDLFELDNLLHIGQVDPYCSELPVYETTRLHTNRSIATAFIL